MKFILLRAAATCVLFSIAPLILQAQTAPSGPIITITDAQFDQMVEAGTLIPFTAQSVTAAGAAALATYAKNSAIVGSYLRLHPELSDLAALAALRPNPNDPNVKLNPNGNYNVTVVNSKGMTRTVQNLGLGTKMAQLAASIQASQVPAVQLQNYTAMYNQLPANFVNGPNPPIAPSQLQGASLETILDAIDSVGSQWPTIVKMISSPIRVITPVGCSAEVGANSSLIDTYYGDEALAAPPEPTCLPPSSSGIYANFNFTNKGALTCVKDQGNRGTCGVFAATSAVEELIAINTGVHVNLSEQDFWETLTLNLTTPPQLFADGYDAGFALGNVLQANYQFAYEDQWDYNRSWSQPSTGFEYVNTCLNYPSSEPACSESAPQAIEYCAVSLHDVRCGFRAAVLPARSSYSIGPGSWVKYGDSVATGTTSVVGQILNIWQPSGPTGPGAGLHPNSSVHQMILALANNNTVMLGFEETNGFGGAPGGYVPVTKADLATDYAGHNVHVVGFVSAADVAATIPGAPPAAGEGYFIIKNSWGQCYGDGGFYYMSTEYVKARAQSIYIVSPLE